MNLLTDPSEHRRFRLPVGLTDSRGHRHRDGALRPATARDEARALQDFRVHLRPEKFLPLVLARTVVRLGELERLEVRQIERLSPVDLAAMEDVYRELNGYLPRAETGAAGRAECGAAECGAGESRPDVETP